MFTDRREAGERLAVALQANTHEHPIVLALPRVESPCHLGTNRHSTAGKRQHNRVLVRIRL